MSPEAAAVFAALLAFRLRSTRPAADAARLLVTSQFPLRAIACDSFHVGQAGVRSTRATLTGTARSVKKPYASQDQSQSSFFTHSEVQVGSSVEHTEDRADVKQGLRWSIERRLEFIDFRLFWEGRINRGDLMDHFGISTPQASADIARYQELAPHNVVYDTRAKCYLATPEFDPVFDVDDSGRYLAQLRAIANGTITREEVWLAEPPSFEVLPVPSRAVESRTLKAVLGAMREHHALKVFYQSMSKSEARWRWITPHSLGFDGFRWHTRAFCHDDQIFKDFVFARMLDVGETMPHDIDPADDRAWAESATVVTVPHPGLSPQQRRAVELDYGMEDGKRAIEVRRAFLYYFLKRLGLDGDPTRKRSQDQHIILVNRKEVRAALGTAQVGD